MRSANIVDTVSRKEVPVQQSDIKGYLVPKINFIIQLCWVLALWSTTWSALVYYYRVFKDIMNTWKARLMLWIPVALVGFWSISCVSHFFLIWRHFRQLADTWLMTVARTHRFR